MSNWSPQGQNLQRQGLKFVEFKTGIFNAHKFYDNKHFLAIY